MVNYYIPWDVDLFFKGITILRSNLGVVINIGFWIFVIISGIYLIVKVISSLGK